MEKTIKDLDIYISDGNYSSKYPRSEEFVDDGIPFIRGNNMVDGDITDDEMYHITPEKHAVLLKGHVKAGDVLITTRGNIGQVAIVPDRHEDSNINAQIVLLRTNPESLYNRYLLWALQSQRANEQYLALQTGTALKQLPVGKLEKLSIKVADINKQHEIADVLDKTYGVIKARRNELKLLDELIKARFVELFGDLRTNTKGWEIKTFDELSYLITDGEHATPRRSPEGIYLLSARNVLNHSLQLDDVDYIDQEEYDRIAKRVVPQEGDVLISCSGTVGRCCSVPADFKFQMVRSAALIRFKEEINPIFAEYMITSDYLQEQINSSKTASSQANLFQGKIKALKGFVPPIELQNEFLMFVKQVDKSKVAVQKALNEAQLLFDSLMQIYFG